jgi:hypothetical protein
MFPSFASGKRLSRNSSRRSNADVEPALYGQAPTKRFAVAQRISPDQELLVGGERLAEIQAAPSVP